MKRFADFLDNKIYYMLLFTVAVIPLHQEFTAFCVGATFLAALLVTFTKGRQQSCVLKRWQQGLLYLLLAIGVISLNFSLNKFISSWNYLYVAGQYSALFFVLLRYGWQEKQSADTVSAEQFLAEIKADFTPKNLWRHFSMLPRPLQLIMAFFAVSVLVSVIGIAQKVFGVTAEGIWVDPKQFPDLKVRVYSTLVNPNILAGYLVLVIAYSTAFFNMTKIYKKWRLAFLGTGLLRLCVCFVPIPAVTGWLVP